MAGQTGKSKTSRASRKKAKKNVTEGIVHINAGFNNIIITVTDTRGNEISWSSAGKCKFRGSKKGTPFAAQMAAEDAGTVAKEAGMAAVEIRVRGPGPGRESAMRAFVTMGYKITKIEDVTPIPHNGVRSKKRRRV